MTCRVLQAYRKKPSLKYLREEESTIQSITQLAHQTLFQTASENFQKQNLPWSITICYMVLTPKRTGCSVVLSLCSYPWYKENKVWVMESAFHQERVISKAFWILEEVYAAMSNRLVKLEFHHSWNYICVSTRAGVLSSTLQWLKFGISYLDRCSLLGLMMNLIFHGETNPKVG